MTTAPQDSSIELAERLRTLARVCQVVSSTPLSSTLREVILAGSAAELTGVAGNDVMVLVGGAAGHVIRRRYSVRSVDLDADRFTLWITSAHDGAGAQWARDALTGDLVDVVGPRGKIPLARDAEWHLFIGDVSALSAFYRLAESIEPPGRAIFIVEIDHDDDAVTAVFDEGIGVTGIFVDRRGRAFNDPAGLLSGLAALALPPGEGHAYLFGEFSVTRVLRDALVDRGLRDEQISRKAYWRNGRRNAEHGEPDKSDA